MGRRATWLLLLAFVLAPLFSSGLGSIARAEDGTPVVSEESATPEPSETVEPSPTDEPSPTETEIPSPTATEEIPTETPTDIPTETPTEPATVEPSVTETPASPTPEISAAAVVPLDAIKVTVDCRSQPEAVRIQNTGNATVMIRSIGSTYQPTAAEPWTINRGIGKGNTKIWLAGPGATGDYVLSQDLFLTNSVWDQETVVVVTDSGTIEVPCAAEPPPPTLDQVKVTITCTGNPETIRVANTSTGYLTVNSIASIYRPTSAEPYAVNKVIGGGGTRVWTAGPGQTGSYALGTSLFLTDSVYDQEGIVVSTNVGDITVKCPPAPPPPTKAQVKVEINCTSDPEKIKVTNNGLGNLVVNSIGSLYDQHSAEPFGVNTTIKGNGGTRTWSAGPGSSGNYALTKSFIFTNSAYEKDGVTLSTNIGTIKVTCPKKPEGRFGDQKYIEVNLSAQYLIAWDGATRVNETYVSTGRPGFDTPTGVWYVNTKLYSQTMSGCIQGECYYVPDVPWVMYFTDWGHALHGAYWHNNFGHVMSHGCVNLPVPFAEWLWYWTPYGTIVWVHY